MSVIGTVSQPLTPTLDHPELVKLLKLAYSAERAAAFAYIGHANSLRDPSQRAMVQQIERDEWHHREQVLQIMDRYGVLPSAWYEARFWVIGKLISASCYVIRRFMAYYFAGRLESGNVCEYFRMMHYFEQVDITEHHRDLYLMGLKEREHEALFLGQIQSDRILPAFERLLYWGRDRSFNDVDAHATLEDESSKYCEGVRLSRVRIFGRG